MQNHVKSASPTVYATVEPARRWRRLAAATVTVSWFAGTPRSAASAAVTAPTAMEATPG